MHRKPISMIFSTLHVIYRHLGYCNITKRVTHLVDAHQHPVDQSHGHHLLQVLHGRVLVDLLHNEVGNESGNVPLTEERQAHV